MGSMPGLLNPQQLQALMVFRQNPALFSNPVLQSQLAMLMWTQMQQQQVPLWPMHQPPPMLQPVTGQQPSSAAAQSACTHQPSCQGPVVPAAAAGRLSEECNSSGGSNDSGCIQTVSGNSPKADHSPPTDGHFGGHRFADDSDSAVTWADRAGRGTDQNACTQSRSPGQFDTSGMAASPGFKMQALVPEVNNACVSLPIIVASLIQQPQAKLACCDTSSRVTYVCISMRCRLGMASHISFGHQLEFGVQLTQSHLSISQFCPTAAA